MEDAQRALLTLKAERTGSAQRALGLLVQDNSQKGLVDLDSAVVFDEA
jgi:hypothetical protein